MNLYFWIPIGLLVLLLAFAYYKRVRILKNLENMPDSSHLIALTDATFKKTIKSGITLVDFWAPWCVPCKIQGPIISELADKYHEKAKIAKLNIDEHKKTAAALGIRSIPTIIIFKDGKPVKKLVGAKQLNALIKALENAARN